MAPMPGRKAARHCAGVPAASQAAMMRRSSAVIPVILAGRMSPHSSIAILRARRSLSPSW
jgi:hypothetical protein